MASNNKDSSYKYIFLVGILTFVVAILISLFANLVVEKLQSIIISLLFLLLIIFINIIFDIIGVAVTVSSHSPFHAKATKKVKGSRQALRLLRNADQVANFSSDVVGDISGTVSGALGASIVLQIIASKPSFNETIISLLMIASISALTVAGKAWGKKVAITKAEDIVFQVSKILALKEEIFGLVKGKKSPKRHEKVEKND